MEAEVFAFRIRTEKATVVAAHKRRKKHEYTLDSIPEGVPTEVVKHRLEGEALVCPACGDTLSEIGVEVVKSFASAHSLRWKSTATTHLCLPDLQQRKH